jgi:hypothetical protein
MRTHRVSSVGMVTAGLCVLLVIACTSSTPSRSLTSATPDASRSMLRHNATLTRAELASVVQPISTLEAVRRLRPEFLYPSERAPGRETADVRLYVNDVYEGEVWQLNLLQLSLIREITFLHPSEATTRFGARCRCPGGVINVQTLIRGK